MNRAENIRISPAIMMLISDQRWTDGALPTDLTKIQPRKPTAPSASTPTTTKSPALLTMRRR